MADEKNIKSAEIVYNTLCEVLDDRHWKYDVHPEDSVVHFIVGGEDIPMEFVVVIDPERELVRMLSQLPFAFSEEKRVAGAIATCQATYKLADGSFDYDFKTGKVFFRLTSSFSGSLISKELLSYMIDCSCYTVDEYNDKFLMIEKGALTLEDFFEKNGNL